MEHTTSPSCAGLSGSPRAGAPAPPLAAFIGTSASSVLVALFTFASGVLIARALGPAARGEYGAVILLAQLAATIGCLSFFDGAIVVLRAGAERLRPLLPGMAAAALCLWAATSAVLVAVLWLAGPGRGGLTFGQGALFSVLIVLEYLAAQLFSAAERSQMRFGLVNLSRVAGPAILCLLLGAVLLAGPERAGLPLVLSLLLLSRLPVLLVWLARYGGALAGAPRRSFVAASGWTGLRLHPALVLGALAGQMDRLIAVAIWPADLLGQYFVASAAVGAGYGVISTAMSIVLLPYLAGLDRAARRARIAQVVRMTLLASAGAVAAGAAILPAAVPLLFGAGFAPAAGLSLGLLAALAPLPLRAVAVEAARARGRFWPPVEIALVSIAVMAAGYALSGYVRPRQLILALGLATLLSALAGFLRLCRDGDLPADRTLLPGRADIARLAALPRRILARGGAG